jgi:hypothetical protein
MRPPTSTRRIRLFVTLAAIATILAVVTFVWHDWVELVFGVEPDDGSGWLEASVTIVATAVAIVAGLVAAVEIVRVRSAGAAVPDHRPHDPKG